MELEANHQTSQTEIIKLKRELDLKLDELEKLESEKASQDQEIERLQNVCHLLP
jgi:chromosome segregation ATPase